MSTARARVNKLLSDVGAVLLRKRKHEVWSLPNGKQLVRASTSSDRRSDHNDLSDLNHPLGLLTPTATEGERRPKVRKPGPAPSKTRYKKPETLSMAQSLRMAGLTDDALRDRMDLQESRMCELERRLAAAESHIASCCACQLRAWLKAKFRGQL